MEKPSLNLKAMEARATDLIGVPWRSRGRDPRRHGTGIDCLGVNLQLWRAGGADPPDPVDCDDIREVVLGYHRYFKRLVHPEPGCAVCWVVKLSDERKQVDHTGVFMPDRTVIQATRKYSVVRMPFARLRGELSYYGLTKLCWPSR